MGLLSNTLLSVLVLLSCLPAQQAMSQPLNVRGDYLYDADNQPFFWCADNAWQLAVSADREAASTYLEGIRNAGFNVVQMALVPKDPFGFGGNAYSDVPFAGNSVLELRESPGRRIEDSEAFDYWDHVTWVLQKAADLGLQIAVAPCWGEYVCARENDPLIGNTQTGYEYGFQIGGRLGNLNDHIIWVLGLNRFPDEVSGGVEIWRAMAEGITDGVKRQANFDESADFEATCMTYLCSESSALWFGGDEWIDFHMWGHSTDDFNSTRNYRIAQYSKGQGGDLPLVNGLPLVERANVSVNSTSDIEVDTYLARRAAYRAALSGGAGVSYSRSGPEDVLQTQMIPSQTELGRQMVHLANLMRSRPFHSASPAQDLLAVNVADVAGYMVASSGEGYIFVYTPTGSNVLINRSQVPFGEMEASWYDPRTGIVMEASSQCPPGTDTPCVFDPPGTPGRGNDWILVLDDPNMPFPAPGADLQN